MNGTRGMRIILACFWIFLCLLTASESYCQQTPAQKRAEIIEAIGKGPAGFPILKNALSDENVIVRRTAARGLVQAGEPAADLLGEALKNDDFEVRRMALIALNSMGKLGSGQLFAALDDKNDAVRQSAGELIDILKRWDFLPDVAPDKYVPVLKLNSGTKFTKGGPAEVAVEVPYDETGRAQGAVISRNPSLFPEGAFSLEIVIAPGSDFYTKTKPNYPAHLIDTMAVPYVHSNPTSECQCGYMMLLRRVSDASAKIEVLLGFGRDKGLAAYNTEPVVFKPGEWYRVLFTYDGKGAGKIYINDKLISEALREGRTGILPSSYDLHIGERATSTYSSFPGKIGLVRLHHKVVEIR
ncbi:MAG: HEAT repeat domain-containing protein [Candidatus Omnitrophica bacterium]|nr:HEAT repeat domain-containing protein [Candidatus Omnitrophota bacterium]